MMMMVIKDGWEVIFALIFPFFFLQVLLSSEATILPSELPRRIMSSRTRTRLVNTALTQHPVAREIASSYKNLLEFKKCIVDVLTREELEEEAVLLNECEVVPLVEVNMFLFFYLSLWLLCNRWLLCIWLLPPLINGAGYSPKMHFSSTPLACR